MIRTFHLAALAALALASRDALACSVCSCGDPLAAASEQASRSNTLRTALETEWLTVKSASDEVEGADTKLEQVSVRAIAVWSPIDALNLAVTLPVVRKQLVDEGGELGHAHRGAHTGLGDVEVGARWFVLNRLDVGARTRQTVSLSVGTSLPTGANGLTEDGERIDEHAQLGTGAWGPYLGVAWRLQGEQWGAQASLSGRHRTESSHDYRYGQALLWSAGGEWRPIPRFATSLGLDGRLARRDRDAGELDPDTGGVVLAAAPAIHFDVARNTWLSLRAQLPVFTHLYGDQSVGPTVAMSLQATIF